MTSSSSDRSSRSPLLCHGRRGAVQSELTRALRRRGPAVTPEDLPTLQPYVRHLRGVRPRSRLLLAALRAAGRRRSARAARARHQRSPEGRFDHRDQQRAYRDRRRRVMDQSSPAALRSTRLPVPDAAPVQPPVATRCVVCGRTGRWLVPMREPRLAGTRRKDDHARAARRDPAPVLRRALEDRDYRGPARPPP